MMFAKIHPVIRLNKLASLTPATYLKVDSHSPPFLIGANVASSSLTICQRQLSIAAGVTLLCQSSNRNSGSQLSLDRITNYLSPTGVRTFVHVSPTEFYDIMGLTPKATSEQIKSTYFKLSKIYHPDVCKDPGGVEKFVLISKAYEVSWKQSSMCWIIIWNCMHICFENHEFSSELLKFLFFSPSRF